MFTFLPNVKRHFTAKMSVKWKNWMNTGNVLKQKIPSEAMEAHEYMEPLTTNW